MPQGSTVSIVVSAGVATVKVPGLVGLPRPDAVAALRELGLTSRSIEAREIADEEQDGIVVRAVPAAAARARGAATR